MNGKRMQKDDRGPAAGDIAKDFGVVAEDAIHATIIFARDGMLSAVPSVPSSLLGIRNLLRRRRLRSEHVRLFRHDDPGNHIRQ